MPAVQVKNGPDKPAGFCYTGSKQAAGDYNPGSTQLTTGGE